MWTTGDVFKTVLAALFLFFGAGVFAQEPDNTEQSGVKMTEWRDETGAPRPERVAPVWKGVNRIERVPGSAVKASPPKGKAAPRVALLVEHTLRLQILDALAQYQEDLAAAGYSSFVVDVWGGTPGFVRQTLQNAYGEPDSLAGAVLMGDISYIEYEVMQKNNAGNWEREAFPCDLHYMDLDGVWSDTLNDRQVVAGNGFYDTWTETDGTRELEIWVCRLPAHNMPKLGNQIDLMNRYFARDHRFRLQRQSYTGMLVYPDDDWSGHGPGDRTNAERVYDPCLVTAVYEPNDTVGSDYKKRLANPMQMVHIRSHGYPGGHGFYGSNGITHTNLTCSDYRTIDPQARFYSLFVCSGCDYTAADFLGGTTVLNPEGGGLLAVGSTKSGGMTEDSTFYIALGSGACFGEAFLDWYNAQPDNSRWRYGMVLIGDATLAPEPEYNDNFLNARGIIMDQDATGAYRAVEYGDNRCATAQPSEPNHAGLPCAKSLWWHYIPPDSGLFFLDTLGSSFNTQLAVYTGGTLGTLTLVAADAGDKEAAGQVTFAATAGTTYRIAVDGSATENGYVTMNCALFRVPLNDNYADAIALGGERGKVTGHNFAAAGEPGETAHGPEIRSVWWVWNAPKKCRVYFDTFGSNFNTVLGAYTGSGPSALTEIAFNDNTYGKQSQIGFIANAGQSYHILVDGMTDGAHTETGNIVLNWQTESMPATDMFADRETIRGMGGVAHASNVGASKETGEPNHAGNAGGKSVWWRFDPPVVELGGAGNMVTFTTKGSSFNTTLAVYTGSRVDNLTLVASNDNASSGVTYSTVSFPMQGTYYAIAVDSYNTASGNIVLTWNVNDNFADSLHIGSAASGDKPGSTLGATKETDEPSHAGMSAATHSVWYTWTAPGNGTISVGTAYGAYRVFVDVYTGGTLAELAPVPGRQLSDGRERVTCCVEAGTTYRIAAATVEQTDFYLVWELATGAASLSLDVSAGQGGLKADGKTIPLPYNNTFDRCKSVQLEAFSTILGWKFLSWSGDINSTQNPITVSLAEDRNISAAFRECKVRTLSINTEGPGTIRVNGVTRPTPYTGSFNDGEPVAVTVFPAIGYALGRWSGDITSAANPLFLTMDQDYSLLASIWPKQMAAISAAKDATLYFDLYGTIANGSGQYLFAGLSDDAPPLKRRAAVQFDVASALPAGARIVDAQLKLYHEYLNCASSDALTITKIARSWGEGASDAEGNEAAGTAALTNDVTWRHRFTGGDWWSTAGGDLTGTTTAQGTAGGEGSWTIASLPGGSRTQIIADVQSWLDQPDTNQGWMLKSDESTISGVKRFASREHPEAEKRPRLIVTYVIEPSGEGEGAGEEPCTEYPWAQTAPEIGGTSMVAGVSVSTGGTVTDVNVTVNITQYANNETTLSLESPSGTRVYLVDQNLTGWDMIGTVFDDEAPVSINDGTRPYAGVFRPVQPLSAFIGEPANGPWKLHVADSTLSGEDYDLTLNSWSMCLGVQSGEGEGESGCDLYPAVDTPRDIVNGGAVSSSLEIFDAGAIQDVNLMFDITCTSASSLDLRLKSPQGTEIILFTELDHDGANFAMTGLDDEAGMSIYDGYPPYNATYIPQQALSAFDGESLTGVWTLAITDLGGCTGTLNSWRLCIQSEAAGEGEGEEGCAAYTAADTPVIVPAEGGGASSIDVTDASAIADINVTLTLASSDARGISLFLESPGGSSVKLVETAPSAGANFTDTTFDDEAVTSIYDGTTPYTGSFRPASLLSALDGEPAAGTWTLHALNADTHSAEITRWSLCITSMAIEGEGGAEGEGGGEGEGEAGVCLNTTETPAGSPLFAADFEAGMDGFEIDNSFGVALGLWSRTDACIAAAPGHSSSFAMYFGETALCSYDYGDAEQGVITSPEIDLTAAIAPELRFAYLLETELSAPGYDYATVEISADSGPFEVVTDNSPVREIPPHLCDPSGGWKQAALDISAYAGSVIRVRFGFNSVDTTNNDFDGFAVDDIAVYDISAAEGEGGEEGAVEGEVEGEGDEEGAVEGEVEGEGDEEGAVEGEGGEEGAVEGEGEPSCHTADQDCNGLISLSELLRVIQFFNSGGMHCAEGTEDGYAPGPGDTACAPHACDYNAQDWVISLSELLRLIQFFNSGGYHACEGSEDGFCPGIDR